MKISNETLEEADDILTRAIRTVAELPPVMRDSEYESKEADKAVISGSIMNLMLLRIRLRKISGNGETLDHPRDKQFEEIIALIEKGRALEIEGSLSKAHEMYDRALSEDVDEIFAIAAQAGIYRVLSSKS